MKRLIRLGLVLVLIATVAASSFGCGGTGSGSPSNSPSAKPTGSTAASPSASPSAAAKEPYKIGAVFAESGNNSPLGTPEKQTAEMMAAQINAAGGINGHPLELIAYDTKSETTECVTLVKKLIEQDKVLAIIGPSSTGESMAILDTVTKAGIPLVSCAASAQITDFSLGDRKWVFKTPQSDVLAINEIMDYLNKNSIKNVALLTDSAGYGQTGRTALVDVLPKNGFNIVADEKFGTTDTDMTTQLTKIKGTDAKAVICWGTNPGPAMVARGMKQLEMTLPLINSHGIANLKFIELAGEAANGVIFPAGKLLVADQLADTDPQKTVLVQYKKDFEAKYGAGKTDTFGGHAYDALNIVVKALTAVGGDKAKIRDYIEGSVKDLPGTGGMFNMSATDHNGLSKGAFVMIKIVDQKWTWLK